MNEPEIIDFHTHPFLTPEENICSYFVGTTPEEQREDFRRCGIRHIAGSVLPPDMRDAQSFDPVRRANRHALELRRIWGDFYVPGCHVHPRFVRESCEELDWMKQNGLRLIGELVPYRMGWEQYDDPELIEILKYAEELDMVVSFHTMGEGQGIERMMAACPHMVFVAAHPGEYAWYMQQLDRLRRHDNACLDISGTGLFRLGMLRYGVEQVGCERLLFGSDYPICSPGMNLGGVLYEKLTDREREAILGGNARRLLRLSPEQ